MEKELEKSDAEPQVYEVGFHIIPNIAESDLGVRVTAVRDVIEGAGGRMISDLYPRQCDLAYPMQKITANRRALYHSSYFGWMKFDAEPQSIRAITAALKSDDFILRFIVIKTVRENTMVPRKVLQQKRGEEVAHVSEKVAEKPAMTEEELDKTIEDLVIS